MTPEQVERWKFVTKSYCFGARPNATAKRKTRLWEEAEMLIDELAPYRIDGWDHGGEDNIYVCDWFIEYFVKYEDTIWDHQDDNPRYFANHLRAALRAGCNAATGNGEGIIGFTVGVVKEMLGGDIPEWLACQYEKCLTDADDNSGIIL